MTSGNHVTRETIRSAAKQVAGGNSAGAKQVGNYLRGQKISGDVKQEIKNGKTAQEALGSLSDQQKQSMQAIRNSRAAAREVTPQKIDVDSFLKQDVSVTTAKGRLQSRMAARNVEGRMSDAAAKLEANRAKALQNQTASVKEWQRQHAGIQGKPNPAANTPTSTTTNKVNDFMQTPQQKTVWNNPLTYVAAGGAAIGVGAYLGSRSVQDPNKRY